MLRVAAEEGSFTLNASLDLANEGVGWAVAVLSSFPVCKVLALVGFAVVRPLAGERPNHRPLLLRAFGSRERLMAMVGSPRCYATSFLSKWIR
jgi:hypothetical protein